MSSFTMDSTDEIELARALGIGELRFISKAHHGGGAATATLHQAAMAVATGAANYVVCYRTLNGRSGHRFSMGVSGDLITSDTIHYSWYMPSGLLTPASWVAMFHRRYAHKFGTTAEQLGHVAISIRDFAVTNPRAFFYQRPLTMEEYLAAKWIVEPFRLYDCCQESDGAACCIVTTPERARDLEQKPALIRGVAQGSGKDQEAMTSFYREDIGAIPEMDLVARQCWEISAFPPTTSTPRSSTTRSRRSCSGSSSRSASASPARRRSSRRRAASRAAAAAHQHQRRSALRGLHPRHERRERGRAARARRVGQPAREGRQPRARHLGRRRADERDDPEPRMAIE